VFVTLAPGRAIKHFTAYDPVAKWAVGKATRRATAHAASLFLDKVLTEMPFPVQALQVDGGSEFKAAFEQACKDKGLALYETYDLPTSLEAHPRQLPAPLQSRITTPIDLCH
jgi:hypothetical protein